MVEESTIRKIGAPIGNQNARKHGFYSKVLDEKEQAAYEKAILIEGMDDEIAILRVKLMSLVERDPENIELITRAINTLVRLYAAKHNIGKENIRGMREAIKNVLKSVAIPLGIEFLTRIGK